MNEYLMHKNNNEKYVRSHRCNWNITNIITNLYIQQITNLFFRQTQRIFHAYLFKVKYLKIVNFE